MSRINHFVVTASDERQLNELLLTCRRGQQFYAKARYVAADLKLKYILGELIQAHGYIFKRLSSLLTVNDADIPLPAARYYLMSPLAYCYEPGLMLNFLRYHQTDLLLRLKKVVHSVTGMRLGRYLSGIAAEVQILNDRIKTMLLLQPDYHGAGLYHYRQ